MPMTPDQVAVHLLEKVQEEVRAMPADTAFPMGTLIEGLFDMASSILARLPIDSQVTILTRAMQRVSENLQQDIGIQLGTRRHH